MEKRRVVDIKIKDVIVPLNIAIKLGGRKNDKHKAGQEEPVHDGGQVGSGEQAEISTGAAGRVHSEAE